jgi:DNA-binding IclR family transcriptional regulator
MVQAGSHLKTVDRALQVLLQFTRERPEWSTSELARALGVHRSIVYRLLKTLERRGFVTQTDRQGRFALGLKLVELGNVVLSGLDLRQVASPFMARLVKETGESAFLSVLSGDDCVCIEKIDSPKAIRAMTSIGTHSPLHAGASGKVLLAHLSPGRIDNLIANGLKRVTPRTVTDPVRLREDLAQIRQHGWAYTVGELTPDVAAVSVPLWDSSGAVLGVLSAAGPASRFSQDRLPTLISVTCRAGEDISAQLVAWHRSPASAEQ